MRKGTRPKQFGKRGSEAKRARPRERTHMKTGTVVNCTFCGKTHDNGQCLAWGQKCRACQGLNHFAFKCANSESTEEMLTQSEMKNMV